MPKATSTPKAASAPKPKASKPVAAASEEPAPRQGFESDTELPVGTSVAPPTASELVGSLADLAVEIAQGAASAGGRALKGALSRLH